METNFDMVKKIIQFKDSIPWVCCFSGNVFIDVQKDENYWFQDLANNSLEMQGLLKYF